MTLGIDLKPNHAALLGEWIVKTMHLPAESYINPRDIWTQRTNVTTGKIRVLETLVKLGALRSDAQNLVSVTSVHLSRPKFSIGDKVHSGGIPFEVELIWLTKAGDWMYSDGAYTYSEYEIKPQVVDPIDYDAWNGGAANMALGALAVDEAARQAANRHCECCDFIIGEADPNNPTLCANCGIYVGGFEAEIAQLKEQLKASEDWYKQVSHAIVGAHAHPEHVIETYHAKSNQIRIATIEKGDAQRCVKVWKRAAKQYRKDYLTAQKEIKRLKKAVRTRDDELDFRDWKSSQSAEEL